VGVCEAAHVRLGATMAIEFAERRNAIVCRVVCVEGWMGFAKRCPGSFVTKFRKCLFLAVGDF
jgi:hypothetical protein